MKFILDSDREQIVRWLLANEAKKNFRDINGQTALDWAKKNGKF